MNPLLARQLRKHLPTVASEDAAWTRFLEAVSTTYDEAQKDHIRAAHTLEVVSSELSEANEKLRSDAENQLRSLSRYYQQTLEIQQGMILCFKQTERGFEHTLCRGSLAGRLGWASERVEGHLLEEFLPPNQVSGMRSAYARAWSGTPCTFEGQTEDASLHYLAHLRPRTEGGEVREVIVSCVEITELKHFERELLTARDRAEAADRAKGEFLAVMSHEIRTPLNAILGFGHLLQNSELTDQQRNWLAMVASSGESLRELIDDVLDFSKIEAGKLELHEQAFPLRDLFENVIAVLRPKAADKNLQLVLALDPHLPAQITSDETRVRQIVLNLVSNAIKFTFQGSVTLSARLAPPSGAGLDDSRLCIDVIDTGVGITPAQRTRIFKPFSQADSSTTRHFGGTGLGLAICKRLVEALGGAIDFESSAPRGTRFFFTLATRRVTVPHDVPPELVVPSQSIPSYRCHVLVLEEDPTNRLFLEQILLGMDCTVTFADTIDDAVGMIAAEVIDVVFINWDPAEANGVLNADALRRLRAQRPLLKIIAVTSDDVVSSGDLPEAMGLDGRLTKPIRADLLKAQLSRVEQTRNTLAVHVR